MEGERKKILVVEDELVNRKILHKILSQEYEVLEAENGQVGLTLLAQNPRVAAVLLDIVMPVMNGYAFLEAVRGTRYANLPILVMTGEQDPESEKKALESGAWDFVTKPYHASVLCSRLKNAIARSEVALYERMQYISEHDALTGL